MAPGALQSLDRANSDMFDTPMENEEQENLLDEVQNKTQLEAVNEDE